MTNITPLKSNTITHVLNASLSIGSGLMGGLMDKARILLIPINPSTPDILIIIKIECSGSWVRVIGHVGQGQVGLTQLKGHDIDRWAHVNVKLLHYSHGLDPLSLKVH